jgi:hypothetical protein
LEKGHIARVGRVGEADELKPRWRTRGWQIRNLDFAYHLDDASHVLHVWQVDGFTWRTR